VEKFLVNMAIVKVNWDSSEKDLLDNYIPLVAYVLKNYCNDIISLEEFKGEFTKVAEFEMPTGAIASLLKRASKRHRFIKKNAAGLFVINRASLPVSRYEEIRDKEIRKYNSLKDKFVEFCKRIYNIDVVQEEVDKYFFEILYEIAPALFMSVSDIDNIKIEKRHQTKYMISRFVSHAYHSDQTSFEAIESFVRGAMLTETFYYSAPAELQGKMRRVVVYFDTQFLLRAIGFCEKKYSEPCLELVNILRSMSVKMRCFRDTYNEIHGILFAASAQLRTRGRIIPRKPGDVWDYYNNIGAKVSDVELDIALLEKKLGNIGILIVDRPPHEAELTVDETALGQEIAQEMQFQPEPARNHDIDCLTAIYRLRRGKPQKYLESCDAIFITTNTALASASTNFFNRNYGISNAAICMSDQVFTTLVWLKAVKKAPNLPKYRLVANCFAAIQPSTELWRRYIEEANLLKEKREITEEDYAVLIHSLEARNKLMDLTLGEDDIIRGNVRDVLEEAKGKYTQELSSQLTIITSTMATQHDKLENLIAKVGKITHRCLSIFLLFILNAALIKAIFMSSPDKLDKANLLSWDAWAFWLFSLLTLANLICGFRVYDFCKSVAEKASGILTDWLRKILFA